MVQCEGLEPDTIRLEDAFVVFDTLPPSPRPQHTHALTRLDT